MDNYESLPEEQTLRNQESSQEQQQQQQQDQQQQQNEPSSSDNSSQQQRPEQKQQQQSPHSKQEIRIFMEGAFDMMHYGHMNAFRLGKTLGTHLIVGINSDESISQCKGPPLMKHEDRLTMVESCQFVQQVIPNTPYIMNQEYIDWILDEYNIDYIVHGEDPCIVDGKDVYETAKQAGKFRTIPRTEGVSTTDIIGRILRLTNTMDGKDQKDDDDDDDDDGSSPPDNNNNNMSLGCLGRQQSKFLTTTSLLHQFYSDRSLPKPGQQILYIDGAWDMFHPGHVALLKAIKTPHNYLIVGIHSDDTVNQVRGRQLPLFHLHERVLSVLGCKYVDDVLIDAPWEITLDMIQTLKVDMVLHGTGYEDWEYCNANDPRYRHAKAVGKFQQVIVSTPSHCCDYSLESIIARVGVNYETFRHRFESKKRAELDHFSQKYSSEPSPDA